MRIFLSYPSELRPLAERLAHTLATEGHDVFFDRVKLTPGDDFDARIRRAVEASQLMIFLIAPSSVASRSYPRSELAIAQVRWPSAAGRVLPVMADPTPLDDIPGYLRSVSILTPEGDAVAEIAAAVSGIARRRSPFVRPAIRIGAPLAILAATAGTWWALRPRALALGEWTLGRVRAGVASLPDEYELQGVARNRTGRPLPLDRLSFEVSDPGISVVWAVPDSATDLPPMTVDAGGVRRVRLRAAILAHDSSRAPDPAALQRARWRPCWTSDAVRRCEPWRAWPAERTLASGALALAAELRARARAVVATGPGFALALAAPNELVWLDADGRVLGAATPLVGEPSALEADPSYVAVGTRAPGTVQLFDVRTHMAQPARAVPGGTANGSAVSTSVESLALTPDAVWVVTGAAADGDAAVRRLLLATRTWATLPYADSKFAFDARGVRLRAIGGAMWGVTTATTPASLYRLTTTRVTEFSGNRIDTVGCAREVWLWAADTLAVPGCDDALYVLRAAGSSLEVVRRLAAPIIPEQGAWEDERIEPVLGPGRGGTAEVTGDRSRAALVGVTVLRDEPGARERVPARTRITRVTLGGRTRVVLDARDVALAGLAAGSRVGLAVVQDRHGRSDVIRLDGYSAP